MQVRKNRVWNNSTVTGNTTKITVQHGWCAEVEYKWTDSQAVQYCTIFVVCLSLLWIRNKRFYPRWRRKQHGGVRPYWSVDTATVKLQRQQLLHQQLLQFPPHVTFVSLQHAKTLLSCHVDNGHATFYKQCVETLVAVNGHCPICRGPIDTTVQFYNN